MEEMEEGQAREGAVTAPVDLTVHIPGSPPVIARVGEITLPLPEDGAALDERQVGGLIADFLASAAEHYRKEPAGVDTLVR